VEEDEIEEKKENGSTPVSTNQLMSNIIKQNPVIPEHLSPESKVQLTNYMYYFIDSDYRIY